MKHKVDNAIIMAAGLSSRFAPLSYELPKALIPVKGEVLIERQIRQLREVGIGEIIVVVGYMKEKFEYLKEKYNIKIVENKDYSVRNNHSTIYAVKDYIRNTYICSGDNYFMINPFEEYVSEAYYAAVYAENDTNEWCLETDQDDWITNVSIGGSASWYMLGHVFWTEEFSKRFLEILEEEYDKKETVNKFWETIYMEHLDVLKLKIRRYPTNFIYEFDSLDELREFDEKYKSDSGSMILQDIANILKCTEEELVEIVPEKDSCGQVEGIRFRCNGKLYTYSYEKGILKEMINVEDQKRIQTLINKVFGQYEILSILRMGGLTNRTYLVEIDNGKYIVRLPGEGTEELINRVDEKTSTLLACELGIDAKLLLFDENTGEKITEYIDDSDTMHAADLRKDSNIVLMAKVLSKLHGSNMDTGVPFDVMDMAESYERIIQDHNVFLYDDYGAIKDYISEIKRNYLTTVKKVPCHNDPLCENWILQNSSNMYLIDWEYAGMNDPMWDLADVSIEADFDSAMDLLLLKTYFDRDASEDEWNAFYINKVLIDYLWSLWGKTRVPYEGESMEQYAFERYERMKRNMEKLIEK